MTDRRYDEEEVRAIFRRASSAARREAPTAAGGLTLSELQGIGREVGLDPEAVARAAGALDAAPRRAVRRTTLGVPVEVGRVVELPRALTDAEWEELVALLRSTFRARGRVTAVGGLREWSNGNLHASVEVSGGRHQLRLGTRKGDAAGITAMGGTFILTGCIVFGSTAMSDGLLAGAVLGSAFAASGVGVLLSNLLRLPRWADRRERQMEHIATRVRDIIQRAPAALHTPGGTDEG